MPAMRPDNSGYPAITVRYPCRCGDAGSALRAPEVPVIIGGGSIRPRPGYSAPTLPGQAVHKLASPPDAPDSAKLLLAHGWGFVGRNSGDVQADNGAGLDKGIIGLVNKGQPRSLDDWGVLRAWTWGDSKLLDYLETDPDVDSKKVGVMGHSRGGKAALVTQVDDPRFAISFISSSGAGGADLYRRNYGETMGNITGTSEFHWFAGNFLRYGAAGHSANGMPVDSHEFIALVAPRAIFIGGGALLTDPVYAPGDAWQDAQGMFMAAVAASPVWDLLGAKGLGTTGHRRMGTLIDSGDVALFPPTTSAAGRTPARNWPCFIEVADRRSRSAEAQRLRFNASCPRAGVLTAIGSLIHLSSSPIPIPGQQGHARSCGEVLP